MKAIDFELIEEESRPNENSRFLSGITRSYPNESLGGYAGQFFWESCLGAPPPFAYPPPSSGPDTCFQKNYL